MKLNEIPRPFGRKSRKDRIRRGRGDRSGLGGTAGRGHKGQKARAGGFHKVGFEGGQMPLQRRLPKRGFTNIFKRTYAIINVSDLVNFPAGSEVTVEKLIEMGKVKSLENAGLKVLGDGELKHNLVVKASKFSETAKRKIEAAGGKAEVLGV